MYSNDGATWGPLPGVLPIVGWRQSQPPYMVVLTDRTGADLFGVRRGSPELHAEVEGEARRDPEGPEGGWSQRRYQQRAGIRVLDDPKAIDEGVGALLRWSSS